MPFTYLPKAAIEKGITRENAAFLLSIIGTNTPVLHSHQAKANAKKIKEQAKANAKKIKEQAKAIKE